MILEYNISDEWYSYNLTDFKKYDGSKYNKLSETDKFLFAAEDFDFCGK